MSIDGTLLSDRYLVKMLIKHLLLLGKTFDRDIIYSDELNQTFLGIRLVVGID